MSALQLRFTFEIETPFRVGSGTARAGVDLEVLDPLGVSEDSFKGGVLDAARTVARLKADSFDSPPCDAASIPRTCSPPCVLCRCFGAPAWPPAAYDFEPLTLSGLDSSSDPEQVRVVQGASRLVSSHNRVDTDTGTVRPEALWSAEWGRPGLFTGRISEREDRPAASERDRAEERRLLVDSLRFLDAIGARRRRGGGRCRLASLEEAELSAPAGGPLEEVWANEGDGWWTTGVRAKLLAPAVSMEGATPGHMGGFLPRIPGSALLGAAASRFASLRRLPGRAFRPGAWGLAGADRDQFDLLFRSGEVRWPFLHEDGVPPRRLSVRVCKHDPAHDQVDLLVLDRGDGTGPRTPPRCPTCDAPLVPPSTSAPRRLVTRTAIEARGHRTAAEGLLFSVHQSEPGREFTGTLRCREKAKELVDELLPAGGEVTLRLGSDRSTKGRALVARTMPDDADRPGGAGGDLLVTLRSDAILLTPDLRYHTTFHPAWLSEAVDVAPGSVTVVRAFPAVRVVESFSAARGLPGPADLALAAGSCVRLRFAEPVNGASLHRAARDGIGIRRREGFGEVSLEWA